MTVTAAELNDHAADLGSVLSSNLTTITATAAEVNGIDIFHTPSTSQLQLLTADATSANLNTYASISRTAYADYDPSTKAVPACSDPSKTVEQCLGSCSDPAKTTEAYCGDCNHLGYSSSAVTSYTAPDTTGWANYDCSSPATSGTFILNGDCTLSAEVILTGELTIVGSSQDMDNLVTITAKTNKRHFQLNGATHKLHLWHVKLTGADISAHSSMAYGGSILIQVGTLNLYYSELSGNKAKQGGGMYAKGASSTNRNNNIVNIYNSIIKDNEATQVGAGFFMHYTVATIEGTTIDNNVAAGDGGGGIITSSDVTITNTIISNNEGDDGGGLGISEFTPNGGTLESCSAVLRQVTFSNNDAEYFGDDFETRGAVVTIVNTIIPNVANNIHINTNKPTTWTSCAANPCSVQPHTGTCAAVDASDVKLGVTCALASDYQPSENSCGFCSGATRRTEDICESDAVLDVAGGSKINCYIDIGGMIFCMGNNVDGELGNGVTSTTDVLVPTAVTMPAGLTAKQIAIDVQSITLTHSPCAIMSDDNIYCWSGIRQYLGIDPVPSSSVLVPTIVTMPTSLTAKQVAVGYNHKCAIMSDDNIYCWGSNSHGQLGDGTKVNKVPPTATTMPSINGNALTAKHVSVGWILSCAIMSDDNIYCWGLNFDLQLGMGITDSTTEVHTPTMVAMPADLTAKQIGLGGFGGCAIMSDDNIYCWGPNYMGYAGMGITDTTTKVSTPTMVVMPAGLTAKRLPLSAQISRCAIMSDDNIYCWGQELGHEVYGGASMLVPTAIAMPSGRKAKKLGAGGFHYCAIMDDDSLYCLGKNEDGQLGIGSTTDQTTLQQVLVSEKTWLPYGWTDGVWTSDWSALVSSYVYGSEASGNGTSHVKLFAYGPEGLEASAISHKKPSSDFCDNKLPGTLVNKHNDLYMCLGDECAETSTCEYRRPACFNGDVETADDETACTAAGYTWDPDHRDKTVFKTRTCSHDMQHFTGLRDECPVGKCRIDERHRVKKTCHQSVNPDHSTALSFAADGISNYVINGANDPEVRVCANEAISFTRSDAGHPLRVVAASECSGCDSGTHSNPSNHLSNWVDVQGSSTETYTFTSAGNYYYLCTAHSNMVGALIVEDCNQDFNGEIGTAAGQCERLYNYTDSTAIYSGTACTGASDCETKCSADADCEGYTDTGSAYAFGKSTGTGGTSKQREDITMTLEVTEDCTSSDTVHCSDPQQVTTNSYSYASSVKIFGGANCTDLDDCKQQCTDDPSCEGYSSACSNSSIATENTCGSCSDTDLATSTACQSYCRVNVPTHTAPDTTGWANYNCSSPATSGTFILNGDCTLGAEVILTGDLTLVGSDTTTLKTMTAATNKRHFTLGTTATNNAGRTLTLWYVKLTGADVSSNSGSDDKKGGAIFMHDNGVNTLRLYYSEISGNKAFNGGAIYTEGASGTTRNLINIDNSILKDNVATDAGGAMHTMRSTVTIMDTTVDNNQAGTDSGGLFLGSTTASITNTIVSNNVASTVGGGMSIVTDGGPIVLRQVTFDGNEATTDADEIYAWTDGDVFLINTVMPSDAEFVTYSQIPTFITCAANPCTEAPYFGTCAAVSSSDAKLGVTCAAMGDEWWATEAACGTCTECSDTSYTTEAACVEVVASPQIGYALTAQTSHTTPNTSDTNVWSAYTCATPQTSGKFTISSDCTLGAEVILTGELTIVGSSQDMDNLVTITAKTNKRHFKLNGATHKLHLWHVKLTGGDVSSATGGEGGAIQIYDGGGLLNLYYSELSSNKAKKGGAILAYGESETNRNSIVNIYNSIINDNEADNYGGAIYLWAAVLTIYDSTIDSNKVLTSSLGYQGGGLAILSSIATITNTMISKNEAGKGGAFMIAGAIVTIRQSSFINNVATNDGMYLIGDNTISLINTVAPTAANSIVASSGTTWTSCADDPCSVAPFNGTCAAVSSSDSKLGVTCAGGTAKPAYVWGPQVGKTQATCTLDWDDSDYTWITKTWTSDWDSALTSAYVYGAKVADTNGTSQERSLDATSLQYKRFCPSGTSTKSVSCLDMELSANSTECPASHVYGTYEIAYAPECTATDYVTCEAISSEDQTLCVEQGCADGSRKDKIACEAAGESYDNTTAPNVFFHTEQVNTEAECDGEHSWGYKKFNIRV